jgi:uncharacterized membrane protein YfcA
MTPFLSDLLTMSILFFSTLTRSTLGFGDALIAMPLLAMLLGIHTTSPLVALVSTLISLIILIRHWSVVDARITLRLLLSAVVGIPVGIFYLTRVPEPLMQAMLGALLISFSLYNLVQPSLDHLPVSRRLAYVFGFAAGLLGGAYNTVGPMLVLYGRLRQWPPNRFRATLQSCFFPAYGFIVIGHGFAGLLTPSVLRLFGLSLPLIGAAIFLGDKLHTAMPQGSFSRYVNIALFIIGVWLCGQSFRAW